MSYEYLADVYDEFMEDTPYEYWRDCLLAAFKDRGITDGLVLDLGCGTGKMTRLLRDAGYDMIGVDGSMEMLNVATQIEAARNDGAETTEEVTKLGGVELVKANHSDEILYLCQDMREFELYGTVRAIVSICDCVNYLTEPEDLVECFKLVNNYLDPRGLFMFDFNTTYKYAEVIGDTTIAENREKCSFIWENFYDPETCINEYDVTIFTESEDNPGLFERNEETHIQRGYTLEEMKDIIKRAGLVFEEAFDAETGEEVAPDTERIFVLAREQGK